MRDTGTMRVEQEIPDQPAVERMFRMTDERSLLAYPGEARVGLSTARLLELGVRFFVARRDGEAVGCGGYVPAGPDAAGVVELKRLFVQDGARRAGVARALLDAMESLAAAEGFERVRLETGARAAAALALYGAAGYAAAAPFGEHAADPSSRFMEKRIGEKHIGEKRIGNKRIGAPDGLQSDA